jgi:hypothetical protein
VVEFKYRAFLSYSHNDDAWSKWLHAELESYRIESDLIGRETCVGPVPNTLRPIFRDRQNFSAGSSLRSQTLAALEAAQFLIVLCSPHSAQSKHVNEEIRTFKRLGRTDRVIPVIVDGEPNDPARECFPPALRFTIGVFKDDREEPIAADVRPHGDGRELAKRKVVAALLGLRLNEIVQRAERARERHKRIRVVIAAASLLLILVGTGSAVYAWQQLKTNVAEHLANLGIIPPRATALELVSKARAAYEVKDFPEAMRLWRMAADQGVTVAMAGISQMYFVGAGVPQNFGESLRWAKMAADKGDTAVMGMIAVHYAGGRGVAKDCQTARQWLEKARAGGLQQAGDYLRSNFNGLCPSWD